MPDANAKIADRTWAKPLDPNDTTRHVIYCDPAQPGECYETLPCANTNAAEKDAIQADINLRKSNGRAYAFKPAAAGEIVTVTV